MQHALRARPDALAARADALADFGAKRRADVFQDLGSFWGIVVAKYRFAGARRRGRGESSDYSFANLSVMLCLTSRTT